MVLLLSSLFFLLCSITQGHPAGPSVMGPSIWVPGLSEQVLAEDTGQHENIPMKLEDARQGPPSIQEDEAGHSTLTRLDTDAPSKPDERYRRRQKRDLREEIQNLAAKYRNNKVKQCCHDGHRHYEATAECAERLREMEKNRCYEAFKDCCFHAQDNFVKTPKIAMGIPGELMLQPSENKTAVVEEPKEVFTAQDLVRCQGKTLLETELGGLASKYQRDVLKQCCCDGQKKYIENGDCMRRPEGNKDEGRWLCYAILQTCCFRAQDYLQNPEMIGLSLNLTTHSQEIVTETKEAAEVNNSKEQSVEAAGSVEQIWRREKTLLETEISALAGKYQNATVERCCHDGHQHYISAIDCMNRPEEKEEETLCSAAFGDCCLYAQIYLLHFLATGTIRPSQEAPNASQTVHSASQVLPTVSQVLLTTV